MTLLIFNTLGPEGMKYKTTRFWWRMKGSCQAVGSWRQHEDIEPNKVKPENGVPGESLPLKGFKNIHILWLICKAAHNLTPNYLSSPTFLYLSIPSSFLKQDSWMCHMLSCLCLLNMGSTLVSTYSPKHLLCWWYCVQGSLVSQKTPSLELLTHIVLTEY